MQIPPCLMMFVLSLLSFILNEDDNTTPPPVNVEDIINPDCRCGVNSTGRIPRGNRFKRMVTGVLGAKEISRFDFPWAVRVVFSCTARHGQLVKWTICSGAIITNRLVASSSHCTAPLTNNGSIDLNFEYVCTLSKAGNPSALYVDIGLNNHFQEDLRYLDISCKRRKTLDA